MEETQIRQLMQACTICPRGCHADRTRGGTGVCRTGDTARVARAAPHFWEEPCISGTRGSGTVFFTGCNLGCAYCQNAEISLADFDGLTVSPEKLADIFLALQEKQVHNINLVTAVHVVPQVVSALEIAKKDGLTIPVVYNSGGYERAETLRMLDGLVDIYLPDCKYVSAEYAMRYSFAKDYFVVSRDALTEMLRQVGAPLFSASEDDAHVMNAAEYNDCVSRKEETEDYAGPLMQKGMIVRHLALPGMTDDSRAVLQYLHETFGNDIYISIMNQYTPPARPFFITQYPELCGYLSAAEYDALIDYALSIGIENAFFQRAGAATAAGASTGSATADDAPLADFVKATVGDAAAPAELVEASGATCASPEESFIPPFGELEIAGFPAK